VEENEVKTINFDIISHELKENSISVIRGFEYLRAHECFEKFQKITDWIVWMDCGKHFRNKRVMGYLLTELSSERNLQNYDLKNNSRIKGLFLQMELK
jgi:hypothetical protein